jgi:hypothetical protein
MKDKFFVWFGRNRKTIGYTVGGLNMLNGIISVAVGDTANGIFWLILGSAIVFDAKMFK